MTELTNITTSRNIFNQMPKGHEIKKKLGRPFGINHQNPEFWVETRNNDPIVLLPPEGYIPLTDDKFQYLIKMQPEWRSQFLKEKNTYTKYKLSKAI